MSEKDDVHFFKKIFDHGLALVTSSRPEKQNQGHNLKGQGQKWPRPRPNIPVAYCKALIFHCILISHF